MLFFCTDVLHWNEPCGETVIRYRLNRLIEEWEYKHQRRLTLTELARETGVFRTTLSRLGGPRPVNTTVDNIDRLCAFFDCQVADVIEYVRVEPVPQELAARI